MWGALLLALVQPEDPLRAAAMAKERLAKAWLQPRAQSGVGVDVARYDLSLEISPSARQIWGYVATRARVTLPVDTLNLDMNSSWLFVDSVAGPVAGWTHQAHTLSLRLARPYSPGEDLAFTIWYHGSPAYTSFGLPFFSERNGVPLIATLSEPFGAPNWWPCKDQPDDKADTVSVTVVVPAPLTVVSNGRLVGTDTLPGGRLRYRWLEEYPIATYLVSLAISQYVPIQEWYVEGTDSVPVVHYLFPDLVSQASSFAVTVPAMHDLSALFGPYPFAREKYGHALFRWGGAMEHQTCTSISEAAAMGGWDEIIVHELAHQWWGDLVTCASFHHIWLNEGFATYSEALWKEVNWGRDAYRQDMAANAYLGPGTIYVEDPQVDPIFDYGLSYQKGAFVLHMLRHVVGDSTFFQALASYRDRYAFGAATTEQFQQVVEEVAGMDMGWFFQQWIYGQYYPWYQFGWSCQPHGSQWATHVRIRQAQTNTGLFVMPVDVRLDMVDGASVTHVVWVAEEVAHAYFLTDAQVNAVVLDPEGWILCRTSEVPLDTQEVPHPTVLVRGPWPNPARGEAWLLVWAPCRIELGLWDVGGHRVWTRPYAEGLHRVAVPLEGLPAGAYTLRASGSCGDTSRVVVVR